MINQLQKEMILTLVDLKAKYDTEESVIVMQTKMMPNSSGLDKNTDYKANITEIENKIFLLLLH